MLPNITIKQIDYLNPRVLVSYSKKTHVLLTGKETRYHFSGILVYGETSVFAKIGDLRHDWQKSSFPLPWSDSDQIVWPD